jgi:Crp-like helix-turn-helix protein
VSRDIVEIAKRILDGFQPLDEFSPAPPLSLGGKHSGKELCPIAQLLRIDAKLVTPAWIKLLQFARLLADLFGKPFEHILRLPRSDVREAARSDRHRHGPNLRLRSRSASAASICENAAPRVCRWLLQTADRIGSDDVPLTQEYLADMLGVRRTTVTLLAQDCKSTAL